ncbi:hypothetical protein P2318_00570 [Myxococcaceae bacterium GXIMD 01537]
MAQRSRSMAWMGAGCALVGVVLGWQARTWREEAPPAPVKDSRVHGLELLPEVLEVGLSWPWYEAPRPLPELVPDPGPLRAWSAAFRELDAVVERPPPLGPALAEAFLASPELFLTHHASRFDVPALDLYGPRPGVQKGQDAVTPPSRNTGRTLAASGKLLALCTGLTAAGCATAPKAPPAPAPKVQEETDGEWLSRCPAESVEAMKRLGVHFGWPYHGRLTITDRRHIEVPHYFREGPAEVTLLKSWTRKDPPEVIKRVTDSSLYGNAKVINHRMSIRMERLVLPTGEEVPICAVLYENHGTAAGLVLWTPETHAGTHAPVGEEEYKELLEGLRPGDFLIVNGVIKVAFGTLMVPEWLPRR